MLASTVSYAQSVNHVHRIRGGGGGEGAANSTGRRPTDKVNGIHVHCREKANSIGRKPTV